MIRKAARGVQEHWIRKRIIGNAERNPNCDLQSEYWFCYKRFCFSILHNNINSKFGKSTCAGAPGGRSDRRTLRTTALCSTAVLPCIIFFETSTNPSYPCNGVDFPVYAQYNYNLHHADSTWLHARVAKCTLNGESFFILKPAHLKSHLVLLTGNALRKNRLKASACVVAQQLGSDLDTYTLKPLESHQLFQYVCYSQS